MIPNATFDLVSKMNNAFGNAKGVPQDINWSNVRNQCKNIVDEFGELMVALGANDPDAVASINFCIQALKQTVTNNMVGEPDVDAVRDALCDISVFSTGAHHLMGIDADADMASVIDGVMTRFIKDEADEEATRAKHAAKGVTEVYFEGEYPTKIMKSAVDQPDAPKGKFMKSASYREPVFYNI